MTNLIQNTLPVYAIDYKSPYHYIDNKNIDNKIKSREILNGPLVDEVSQKN